MTTMSHEPTNSREGTRPDDNRQGNDVMRIIGAGLGSLGGAGILFLSVLTSQARPEVPLQIAIFSFAVALPLLVFTTVLSYALSIFGLRAAFTSQIRRAIGVTMVCGILGTLGIVVGIAGILWQALPLASIAFVVCTIGAVIAYSILTRQMMPQRGRPQERRREQNSMKR